jgi:glycosyltransferase involved in cell wall biosynthesis
MTDRSASPPSHSSTGRPRRVVVVGADTHFLSAMSYYTLRLSNALAERFTVAAIPMRRLIPTFLYPGRSRVGTTSTRLDYDSAIDVFNGIDWYWGLHFFHDLIKFKKWKPDVVIFEWWTGSVLHTYLALALLARLQGASIIVEIHEVVDSGEERIPFARAWIAVLGRPFFRLVSAFVIHSESDREPVNKSYRLRGRPCVVIPHGPLDHHSSKNATGISAGISYRSAPSDTLNLLFFGLIRPYKGLEDLVRAFDLFDDEEVKSYWLTVVGETWEGWDLPVRLIQQSRHRQRITLINRFVHDDEVVAHFANADAVVLPYHRSSASSPAHVAMSNGLPLVITAVGGLPAAVKDYEGAILSSPRDPVSLRDAIRLLPALRGRRFRDPHSWNRTVTLYENLMKDIDCSPAQRPMGQVE